MPAKYYECPDGKLALKASCIAGRCRQGTRCLSLTYLNAVAEERLWEGKPSTTQLANNDTRLNVLRITKGFAINPRRQGFRVGGTQRHDWLDTVADRQKLNVFSEETFDRRSHTGRMDSLEIDLNADGYILIDYKNWASYKVALAMGLVSHEETDPTGAVYVRNGRGYKVGDPKKIKVFEIHPERADCHDLELQMSDYAIGWEEAGYSVTKLLCQPTIRDANTLNAAGNGFPKGSDDTFLFEVKRLPTDYVNGLLGERSKDLLRGLGEYERTGVLPPMCCEDMRWNNSIRCKSYCEVVQFCPEGLEIKQGGD